MFSHTFLSQFSYTSTSHIFLYFHKLFILIHLHKLGPEPVRYYIYTTDIKQGVRRGFKTGGGGGPKHQNC